MIFTCPKQTCGSLTLRARHLPASPISGAAAAVKSISGTATPMTPGDVQSYSTGDSKRVRLSHKRGKNAGGLRRAMELKSTDRCWSRMNTSLKRRAVSSS